MKSAKATATDKDVWVEKKRKRLERKMETQRLRREKVRVESIELRDALQALERELHQLNHRAEKPMDLLLEWHDVAQALEDDKMRTVEERTQLMTQVKQLKRLYARLSQWISTAFVTQDPTSTFHAVGLCLNHVNLLAPPDCRKHGLDWLTLVLGHNTESMFQKYAFYTHTMSTSDDGLLAASRVDLDALDVLQIGLEINLPGNLSAAHAAVHEHVVKPLSNTDHFEGSAILIDRELAGQISTSMSYVRRTYERGLLRVQNILYRTFHDAPRKRIVIVGQNIPQDEAFGDANAVNIKTMTWVVLDQIAPQTTRLRLLGLCSHMFGRQSDGPLPREVEAKSWGCDLSNYPDNVKDDVYTRHLYNMTIPSKEAWGGFLRAAKHALEVKKEA
ncbi:hypothetical protein LEN26_006962 [Aphanomyces euteiches]|nr:hypothetical protein AeMF1_020014 [Aphanomyces euteiches]KAH9133848.1 hypothetical protein LEN26_006962 [Aphanomyces euteiches]KAH9185270.1 hypothetical protein AeNC1_012752 [Aphanomyces euteiches]